MNFKAHVDAILSHETQWFVCGFALELYCLSTNNSWHCISGANITVLMLQPLLCSEINQYLSKIIELPGSYSNNCITLILTHTTILFGFQCIMLQLFIRKHQCKKGVADDVYCNRTALQKLQP